VVSEELLILASCLLRPMSRNSVLGEFSVRRSAVIRTKFDLEHCEGDLCWSRNESGGRIEGDFFKGPKLVDNCLRLNPGLFNHTTFTIKTKLTAWFYKVVCTALCGFFPAVTYAGLAE